MSQHLFLLHSTAKYNLH